MMRKKKRKREKTKRKGVGSSPNYEKTLTADQKAILLTREGTEHHRQAGRHAANRALQKKKNGRKKNGKKKERKDKEKEMKMRAKGYFRLQIISFSFSQCLLHLFSDSE